ncbi:MAG: hypothetical protein K6U10_13955 [Acidobacteriia bacterium]|nr:hypothetical protein [Methyloceanibacter sp.]MCL6492905.1 hypothetical protein [Terriglobia bacterium]
MVDRGTENGEENGDARPRPPIGALIALLVLIVLVLGGLWLTQKLSAQARLENCLASGRTNCLSITSPEAR